MKISIEQRFMKFVDKTSSLNGCWLWMGSKNKFGYGRIWKNGKSIGAHRISYELYKGKIPKGLFCLHKCDVRNCVNPDHILLGTHQQNMTDRNSKNRTASKLTKSQVMEIRASKLTQKELADLYKVDKSNISLIINKKNWKHLN